MTTTTLSPDVQPQTGPLLASAVAAAATASAVAVAVETPALHNDLLYGCKVFIAHKAKVMDKLKKFQDDGSQCLAVITDFDFTLSRFHNKRGERGCSCHKLLEDSGLLCHEYHQQAQAVQAHYYPIEIDPTLDQATRLPLMIEWAHRSHELLVKYGLTRDLLQQAVDNAVAREDIRLRQHLVNFFEAVQKEKVPLLIFSAGIADVLEAVLKHFVDFSQHPPYVISNRCIFEGQVLKAFPEPIIHVFNKRAAHFLNSAFFTRADCRKRHNVLLIGDSLGDVHMAEGMETVVPELDLLKIGFLNDKVQERLDTYAQEFDIVILDDPGFDVPLGIINKIGQCD